MSAIRNLTVASPDGVELAVAVSGSGPDLLFVHGLGSAQVLWDPIIGSLQHQFRCWNLDLRGHGRSGRSNDRRYHLSDYDRDISAVLDHIAEPTIGIGHSLGGISLVRASAQGSTSLRALYILDSAVLRRPGETTSSVDLFERQLAMVRSFQAEGRPVDDYEAELAQAMNPMGDTNLALMVPHQLRGRATSLSQMDPACMAAVVDGRIADTFVPPSVDVPLRLIAADPTLGASFTPDGLTELHRLSPQAQVVTMTGVGHQLMMMRNFDTKVLSDLSGWLQHFA